jgi:hypothetical protein
MLKNVPSRQEQVMRTTLAERLRDWIANGGQSINRIAVSSGIPQPVLHRFAKGEKDMNLRTATKLAQYFGMELVGSDEAELLRSLRESDAEQGEDWEQAAQQLAQDLDLDFIPGTRREAEAAIWVHSYEALTHLERCAIQSGSRELARQLRDFMTARKYEAKIGPARKYLERVVRQAKAQGRGRKSLTRKAATLN